MSKVIEPEPARVLTPEVVDPRLAEVEKVARWLDYAFRLPGGFRFGIDGIVGLIPGVGDVFGAVTSLYIIVRAIQLGVPKVTVGRMLVNIGIESLAGAVPWVGDLFDIVFKANRRNYHLLRQHMLTPRRQAEQDRRFMLFAIVFVVIAVLLPVALVIYLLRKFPLV